jgi:hypothetical protein
VTTIGIASRLCEADYRAQLRRLTLEFRPAGTLRTSLVKPRAERM